jgi:uncharacterized protein (DUF2141 family)
MVSRNLSRRRSLSLVLVAGAVAARSFASAQTPAGAGPPVSAPEPPIVELRFTGMKTGAGAIMAALYGSEDAYAQGAAPLRALRIPVVDGVAVVDIEGLAPGRYAVKAFRDLKGDGKLAMNPFGVPLEPVAFSNNAKVNLRAPSWTQTVFDLALPKTVQTITID